MTVKEALNSIVDDGIRLGAGDFVEIDALKVAAEVLENVVKGELVEVVRCKDCKHWECWRVSGEGSGNCLLDIYGNLWNGNDYCSYGERKEENEGHS